eukprot:CAMPEP_0202919716 /NCGR_PEP_ID=MMETSP1392-20130828/76477_1 /ASSEMBLY_ACC=CAM_ASM_000868 /TAXON_ID=225041 /ORGANISM="Chlamydomonas chlamydogama, Strain SAG 11-48b" /LENGTH=122 /DNA_ID=CAMNT_0049613173 /DNA_START=352 /DNA_END=720 /DNA_ORIENTATION=-
MTREQLLACLRHDKNKLTATEEKLAATEEKLAATEEKLAATEEKLTVAEQKLAATKEKLTVAEQKLAAARNQSYILNQTLTGENWPATHNLEQAAGVMPGTVVLPMDPSDGDLFHSQPASTC